MILDKIFFYDIIQHIMPIKNRSITLEEEIIKKVEKLAKEKGRSFSNMVQRILTKYLEKEGKKKTF